MAALSTEKLDEARYADTSRIRSLLADSEFDVIIATRPENTAYLSGFYHPDLSLVWERMHIVVWPSGGDPVYIVPATRADNWNGHGGDAWALEESRPFVRDIRGYVGEGDDMIDVTAAVLEELGLRAAHVGIEERSVPYKVTDGLRRRLPDLRYGDAWPLVNRMRMVKTPAEVELIASVNRLTATHLERGLASIRPGEAELQVGARISTGLFRDGAHELAHSIFGAGCRAGQWHPWPSANTLEDGMLVRSDWGVRIDGYTSDIARTSVVGRASREQRTRFDRISAVHDVVVDAIRPGVVASDLVRLARREYERQGEEFRWTIVGHSIGLVLHEEPHLTVEYDDELVEGMTLQVELGWVDSKQGYHIEDTIFLGRDGATNLTTPPGTRTLIESGRA
jgi:Xaa-Pro aminopeptidase